MLYTTCNNVLGHISISVRSELTGQQWGNQRTFCLTDALILWRSARQVVKNVI